MIDPDFVSNCQQTLECIAKEVEIPGPDCFFDEIASSTAQRSPEIDETEFFGPEAQKIFFNFLIFLGFWVHIENRNSRQS